MKSLILICALSASAVSHANELGRRGEWGIINASDNSGDVIAITTGSNAGEMLGYRCTLRTSECVYVLVPGSKCDRGDSYPMLMNAKTGASQVEGVCLNSNEKINDMVLKPYKSIENAIKNSSEMIGFAIPMASGAFKAVRFSTDGAFAAIQEAEKIANQRKKSRQNSEKATTGFF